MMDSKKSGLLRAAPRITQILGLLVRHKFLGILWGKRHWPHPKEVRETVEKLGLTFIKFGQVIALRRDLLPHDYIKELELLHDQLPEMGFDIVREIVESELGAPLGELFSLFSVKPVAAATIAQVHDATMPDGRHVAVKVQRPGLKAMIAKDIEALTFLVVLGEKLFPSLRALDLTIVVREFTKSLNREIDFNNEARTMVLFRTTLKDLPNLWIPNVVEEYSRRTLLTMDYSEGERVDLYARVHPEAMPKAFNTLVKLTLQTIFEEGFFHADPHPGNVFILPDGRLSLIDFGMTGNLDEHMRESLILLLEAIVKGDAPAATEAYLEMAPESEKVNRVSLLIDIKAVLYEIQRSNLADVSIGDVFESLLRAGTLNGVHNPGEFFLLTRAFVILESMMRELAPHHNYMESFREEISRLIIQHFSPVRIKERTTRFVRDLERLINDAPGDTRRVLRNIAEGNLGKVQAPVLEALGERISRNLIMLSYAIAFGSLVIGGSMLLIAGLGGWHHILGQIMVISGFFGMFIIPIGAWLRARSRR